jgi:hypothetical protein
MPHGRKLTKQEIAEMRRQRREDGLHPTEIAKNFNVGRSTAYKHTKTVRIPKSSKHYKMPKGTMGGSRIYAVTTKPKGKLVKPKPKAKRDLLQLRLAINHLEAKVDQLLGVVSSSEIRKSELRAKDSKRWQFLGRNPFRKEF